MQLVIKILLFLFMSIFDPHALYYHHQRKTHTGQVYQKKPTNYQATLSRTEIPRSINVLQTYGYRVSGPGNYIVDTFQYTIPFLVRFQRSLSGQSTTLFNFSDLLSNGLYDEINEIITPFAESYDSQFSLRLNLTSIYVKNLRKPQTFTVTIPDVLERRFSTSSDDTYLDGFLINSYNGLVWIGTQRTAPDWQIQPMQQYPAPDDLPDGVIFSHLIQDNDLYSQMINEQIDPEIDYRFLAINSLNSGGTQATFTFEGYLIVSFLKKIM